MLDSTTQLQNMMVQVLHEQLHIFLTKKNSCTDDVSNLSLKRTMCFAKERFIYSYLNRLEFSLKSIGVNEESQNRNINRTDKETQPFNINTHGYIRFHK